MAHGTERYAAGLPWRAERTLTDAERRWLSARFRRGGLRIAMIVAVLIASAIASWAAARAFPSVAMRLDGAFGLWFCAAGALGTVLALVRGGRVRIPAMLAVLYIIGLAAVGALVPELTDRPHLLTRAVFLGIVLLGVGVLTAAVARNSLLFGNLYGVRADLEAGVVDCFEGVLAGAPPWELRRLIRNGYASAERGAMRLDVLPGSGLVVRADGRRCETWACVHIARVAPPLPHALRVNLPAGVAPLSSASDLTLQRRSLTPEEQAELDGHILRLRCGPWLAIAATGGMLAAAGWQLMKGDATSTFMRLVDPVMLGWYLLSVSTVLDWARRTIAARKLTDDRKLRWVVTVDDRSPGATLTPPRLEVLPVSQLAWTENAAPAAWRTSRY